MAFAKIKEDGDIREFWFGVDKTWKTSTTNLDAAIRRFRVGCPQPYLYVDSSQKIKERVATEIYHEDIVVGAKKGATIPVFTIRDGKRVKVASIPVEEESSVPLLAGDISAEVSAVMRMDLTGQKLVDNRRNVDFQLVEIERKKTMLELQMHEMNAKVEKLKAEVATAMKCIWMVELYLGSKQELHVLRSGAYAPATEPLTVMQRVLCMDEEILVWAWFHKPELLENNEQGFGYQNIADFDRWLLESEANLDQILPAKKGIIALRVRREPKKHEIKSIADAFAAIEEDACDKQTYILIRNGENLYRIWADTNLWPRFFPRRDEFDLEKLKKDNDGQWHSWDDEKLEQQRESYMRGLIVLQGLLDHTTIFHPLPEKISVFDTACVERTMRLIRDDELALNADNSMMDWYHYKKFLHGEVRVGARVLYCKEGYEKDDKLRERTGNGRISDWPSKRVPFIITEHFSKVGGWSYGGEWKFIYKPGDNVYRRWDDDTERKRGVGFRAYCDEVIAFDAVSVRYLKHLLLDRSQREQYARCLPTLRRWWIVAKAEAKAEEPFIRLVLSQAGVQQDDPDWSAKVARCRRLVRWWKLRTKEARTLSTDEAKALRMILKAFQAGEDYDDDPERGLPEPKFVKNTENLKSEPDDFD